MKEIKIEFETRVDFDDDMTSAELVALLESVIGKSTSRDMDAFFAQTGYSSHIMDAYKRNKGADT